MKSGIITHEKVVEESKTDPIVTAFKGETEGQQIEMKPFQPKTMYNNQMVRSGPWPIPADIAEVLTQNNKKIN